MIHDLLLSLSLFDKDTSLANPTEHDEKLLSPPEQALVASMERLGEKHRKLAKLLDEIGSSEGSLLGRAVASSIRSKQLLDFQDCILQAEREVLVESGNHVGAYGVVSLSSVVRKFEPWNLRMDWLLRLASRISGRPTEPCNGVVILNWLRAELHTGYTDVQEMGRSLCQVAENAWLRQLSSWMFFGKLLPTSPLDFLIQKQSESEDNNSLYFLSPDLIPTFVSMETANSILFIGKSIEYLRNREGYMWTVCRTKSRIDTSIMSNSIQRLADLSLPLKASKLSLAVEAIRLTLAKDVLQQLLPRQRVIALLQALRDFLLLGQGEFAICLISQANQMVLLSDQRPTVRSSKIKSGREALRFKESELLTLLEKTWANFLSDEKEESVLSEETDVGRKLLRIKSHNSSSFEGREGVEDPFREFLCGRPVYLSAAITSPMDIICSKEDMRTYSQINAYLLAMRRAHIRLSQMWQASYFRREHPAPLGPPQSNRPSAKQILAKKRQRCNARTVALRQMWFVCSSVVAFLSELGLYYQQAVIAPLWSDLRGWLKQASGDPDMKTTSENDQRKQAPMSSTVHQTEAGKHSRTGADDPEAISLVHRYSLKAITQGLLLGDESFKKLMYDLLRRIEHLIACSSQMQSAWQAADLEDDEGVFETRNKMDIEAIMDDLISAVQRLDVQLKAIVKHLRTTDVQKEVPASFPIIDQRRTGFAPGRVASLDRLLTKLDFASVRLD